MFRKVEQEWPIKRLLRHLPKSVDLVIAEVFRSSEYPCIEVYRRGVSLDLKCRDSRKLLAVVGDDPGALAVPQFHRDAVRAITEFLLKNLFVKSSLQKKKKRVFYAFNKMLANDRRRPAHETGEIFPTVFGR